jgi:hypothetical protein
LPLILVDRVSGQSHTWRKAYHLASDNRLGGKDIRLRG